MTSHADSGFKGTKSTEGPVWGGKNSSSSDALKDFRFRVIGTIVTLAAVTAATVYLGNNLSNGAASPAISAPALR